MKGYSTKFVAAVAFLMLCIFDISESCSCQRNHIQTQFCNSDFVILSRIVNEKTHNERTQFKIRVRKTFKATEKAREALKFGILETSQWSSMCGVSDLQIGKLYVVMGKINNLKAHINLCTPPRLWQDLSRRQRKGLNKVYKYGCTCRISRFGRKNKDSCLWNQSSDCEEKEGICLRQLNKSCRWNRNKALTKCQKEHNPHYNKFSPTRSRYFIPPKLPDPYFIPIENRTNILQNQIDHDDYFINQNYIKRITYQ